MFKIFTLEVFDKCPICGDCGEDMVFAFYCYNEKCQNYKPLEKKKEEGVGNVELELEYPFSNWPYRDDEDD